ncbi:MAG: peptidylprolyl isomerase [Clostridia bacterium]|nr:peptidylprolyl isomerase [Clostridia bacterium]
MSFQTSAPVKGDTIAVMHTNMGDIKIKLFKNEVPRTAQNFIELAKKGYNNGNIFHRVIKDFMIQGGDPTGTGMGGESIYGEKFEDEFDASLHNIRGALSMANAGPNTNGSQFFIVQADTCPETMLSQMEQLVDRGFPRDTIEDYKALGGTPWLDFKHSVFGQVYEGMSVVDDIANVRCGAGDRPMYDVVIEGIDIEQI